MSTLHRVEIISSIVVFMSRNELTLMRVIIQSAGGPSHDFLMNLSDEAAASHSSSYSRSFGAFPEAQKHLNESEKKKKNDHEVYFFSIR